VPGLKEMGDLCVPAKMREVGTTAHGDVLAGIRRGHPKRNLEMTKLVLRGEFGIQRVLREILGSPTRCGGEASESGSENGDAIGHHERSRKRKVQYAEDSHRRTSCLSVPKFPKIRCARRTPARIGGGIEGPPIGPVSVTWYVPDRRPVAALRVFPHPRVCRRCR